MSVQSGNSGNTKLSRGKSASGAVRPHVNAHLSDTGSLSFGYNIQKFLEKYL